MSRCSGPLIPPCDEIGAVTRFWNNFQYFQLTGLRTNAITGLRLVIRMNEGRIYLQIAHFGDPTASCVGLIDLLLPIHGTVLC